MESAHSNGRGDEQLLPAFLGFAAAPKSRDDAAPPEIEYGLYIPATQHLIHTEAARLMRTSKRCESYNLPCCLHVRSLGPRWRSQNMIWSILHRYTFTDKAKTLSRLHRKKVGQSWELCSQDLQSKCQTLPLMTAAGRIKTGKKNCSR